MDFIAVTWELDEIIRTYCEAKDILEEDPDTIKKEEYEDRT